MSRFCKECGAALAENAKFCTSCGSPVDATANAVGTAEPLVPDPVSAPVARPAAQPVTQPVARAADPAPAPAYATAPAPNNTTTWLIGGGALLVALAAIAAYFIVIRDGTPLAQNTTQNQSSTPTGVTQGAPTVLPDPSAALPGAPAPAVPPVLAPALPGAASGAPVGQAVVKYANAKANIRDIATADAPSRVVASLQRGASVQGVMHVGINGSSYWLKLTDGRGFVSAVNLVDAPPPAQVAQAAPSVAPATKSSGPTCTVMDRTGSSLRIRNAPNGNKVLGGLPNRMQVRFINEDTDVNGNLWYLVDPVANGYATGWVFAEHVEC
jgi:Bacterial SH3 domain/zinc-ribbon domain